MKEEMAWSQDSKAWWADALTPVTKMAVEGSEQMQEACTHG